MTLPVSERIVAFVRTNGQARVSELWRVFSPLSRATIHKHLKTLTTTGILTKVGRAPVVFYTLTPKGESTVSAGVISGSPRNVIDEDYLYITPQGQILVGLEGFTTWAKNIKQTAKLNQLAEDYLKTREKFEQYRAPEGWIDATFKIKETFLEASLNKLLYADFYSLPRFGKTKLGAKLIYAKQSQNIVLGQEVAQAVKPVVEKIILSLKIDAVGFIPPSLPRTIQFMTELENNLRLSQPKIKLVKTRLGQVIVAQKTLEKLEERVANARDTIFPKETVLPFKNVLLIDDAVGSGASLNETAKKIKNLLPASSHVFGFAVVGSFKGFEVIREV